MSVRVLVVDDDPAQRRILEEIVRRAGHEVVTAEDGDEALEKLKAAKPGEISIIVLDLVMPGLDGMGVLERMGPDFAAIPVIVQTAKGGIETVVGAMRAGATDFVVKPVSPERLVVSIENALKFNVLAGEIKRIRKAPDQKIGFSDLIAGSPSMVQAIGLGQRAAQSNIPILLEGESGVGKELFARAIQGSSPRADKAFVTVNCGAIPENLVESILFGHEKGAFTGATEKRDGKFVEADGGTLFLDEVGELPLDTQVKLLRAVQEGEVDPVGGKKPRKVDIRLISATNRDFIEMVRAGKFREDLYYRLNVFPVLLPPLRNRMEDVPDLVRHFVARFGAEEGKKISGISGEALELLLSYSWPGNIRQLENTIFRAVVLADNDQLGVNEFPQIAQVVDGFEASLPSAPVLQDQPVALSGPAMIGDDLPALTLASDNAHDVGISVLGDTGDMRRLEEVEADMIRMAITRYNGHMSEVARKLGIGRSTLYRKVRDLGLEDATESDAA